MSFTKKKKKNVFCFVGISGKPGPNGTLEPLSERTMSGKIISSVQERLNSEGALSIFYRDNLVRNPPMANGKLRYPTASEMKNEWSSFERRLSRMKSNVIILLGELVSNFFAEKRNITRMKSVRVDGRLLKWAGVDEGGSLVLAVAHPSYMGIYARKRLGEYMELIKGAVEDYSIPLPN